MGFRWFFAAVVAAVVAFPAVPVAAAAGDSGTAGWSHPVAGAVVRPFRAPVARYGPGHRGVDFSALPGTPVLAAHDGIVSFAGVVAGSSHVVVDHGDTLRTSSSFLATIDVRRGQRVVRGQVIGTTGGIGPEHDAGLFHFGLRVGDGYVDPMRLFAPVDLAAVIRLVPVHSPARVGLATPAFEARALTDALRLPRSVPGLEQPPTPNVWNRALGVGGDLVGGLVEVAAVLTWPARTVGQYVFDRTSAGAALTDLRSLASRFAGYLRNQGNCTSEGRAATGGGGSGHFLLAVGGINSSTDPVTGHTFGLDTRALGYRAGEVSWFSYAADRGAYQPSDTWGELLVKAYALRNQLRDMQAGHPGREVDLVAHSQGGVVVDLFLQAVYDPGDPTLPPLGTVVTLSSPHLGAPAASVAAEIRAVPDGRRLLDWAESLAGGAIPPSAGRSTNQLAERSQLMRSLWDRSLPDQIALTSVAGDDDTVVPGPNTEAPGARKVMVDPAGLDDHAAIVDDPSAMREVRLALEQRAPGCVGLLQGLRGAIEPVLIRRAELNLGHAIAGIARHRVPVPVGLPIGALIGSR